MTGMIWKLWYGTLNPLRKTSKLYSDQSRYLSGNATRLIMLEAAFLDHLVALQVDDFTPFSRSIKADK